MNGQKAWELRDGQNICGLSDATLEITSVEDLMKDFGFQVNPSTKIAESG
jgi:hypothetical protein